MSARSHRLDAPLPQPAQGAATRAAARHALTLCVEHAADGPAAFTNADLNTALDPLRLHPVLSVRCAHCERGLGFVALNTQGATLVSGNKRQPPRRRRGGIYDLDAITTAEGGGRRLMGWQEDAEAGRGNVEPTGEAPTRRTGFAQRRAYQCPNCSNRVVLNNTRYLRLYLTAIERGDSEIRLK
jgi:hypothetical protein